MIHSAIAFLFGIHALTPAKVVWIALTLVNVGMMAWLACRYADSHDRIGIYMFWSALLVIIQGSPAWSLTFEAIWAGFTAVWVWSTLPRDKYGRIFALSIGLLMTCALMYAVPPPWPHYDPAMYYTRLYSTAAFLGIVFGINLLGKPQASTIIAMPWFMAVLVAGSQRGWDRWTVGIWANAVWTLCLICWLATSRASLRASSMPDVPADHRRSSQYLPWMDISSLPRQQRGIRR